MTLVKAVILETILLLELKTPSVTGPVKGFIKKTIQSTKTNNAIQVSGRSSDIKVHRQITLPRVYDMIQNILIFFESKLKMSNLLPE